MSLKKRKSGSKKSRKSSKKKSPSKPKRVFQLRFPNMWREDGKLDEEKCWHKVEAESLQAAKLQFAGGTVHKMNEVISKEEDMKGIPKAHLERYEELGSTIEPMILHEFEKKVKSPVEEIDKYGYDHWRVETEDGEAYHIFGTLDAMEQAAVDYLVDEDMPDNIKHYEQWLIDKHVDEDYFFRNYGNDERHSISTMVEDEPERYGLTDEDVRPSDGDYTKVEGVVQKLYDEWKENVKEQGIANYMRDMGYSSENIADCVDTREMAIFMVKTDGPDHILGYDDTQYSLPYGALAHKEDR